MEKESLGLNVILEGEVKQKFLEIKRKKGLKNNSEVIRAIIKEFWTEHFPEA